MSDLRAEHSSDLPRGRRRNNKKKKSKPLNLGRDTSSHAHGLNARTRLPCFSWMDGWMDPRDRLLGGKWVAQTRLARVVVQAVGQWGEDGFSLALALFSSFWLLPYAMSKRSSPQISGLFFGLLWPLHTSLKRARPDMKNGTPQIHLPCPEHQGGGSC